MKKIYRYGNCIPESIKIYNKLKKKGHKPLMVEGWVEVNNPSDMLPDKYFLMRFFPDEFEKLTDMDYNDYPTALEHTWVEVNNHKVDITRNQFDRYGGIKKYYVYERYIK